MTIPYPYHWTQPTASKKDDARFCANPICTCHEYVVDELCLRLQATMDGKVITHFHPLVGTMWVSRKKYTYLKDSTFYKVWFCGICSPAMEEHFEEHGAYPSDVEPFVLKEKA